MTIDALNVANNILNEINQYQGYRVRLLGKEEFFPECFPFHVVEAGTKAMLAEIDGYIANRKAQLEAL